MNKKITIIGLSLLSLLFVSSYIIAGDREQIVATSTPRMAIDNEAVSSLLFDGDDYVTVTNFPAYATMTTQVLFKRNGTGSGMPRLYSNIANDALAIGVALNTDRLSVASWLNTQFKVEYGIWYDAVLVQNGTSNKLYIDGVLVFSGSNTAVVDGTGTLTLGKSSEGVIGNEKVFRRWNAVLTDQQILELHFNNIVPSTNLVAEYNLNESSGTTAYDTSGNGNNGTITGATWSSDTPTEEREFVDGNMVYNGDFSIQPPFISEQTSDGRWIDGTLTGTTNSLKNIIGWRGSIINGTTSLMVKDGYNSLHITFTNNGFGIARGNSDDQFATPENNAFLLEPNTSYTISGWVKAENITGDVSAESDGASISVNISDGNGDYTQYGNALNKGAKTNQDWTYYEGSFTTESDARSGNVHCQVYGHTGADTMKGDWYFRDIQLRPTYPISERQTLVEDKASLLYDGSSDYILVPNSTSIQIGDKFTYSIKMKYAESTIAKRYLMYSPTGWHLRYDELTGGQLRFYYDGTNSFFNTGIYPKFGEWQEVTVTVEESGSDIILNAYLDGVLAETQTKTGALNAITTQDIYVAGITNTEAFKGNVTHARMWHSVLTANQISELYYNKIVPTSDLLFNYDINEGAGATVTDSSGNSNNGTITGATWSSDTPSKERKVVNGNLIENGDFEFAPPFVASTTASARYIDGSVGGSTSNDLFNWATTLEYAGAIQYDSSEKHSGNYSIKVRTHTTPPSNNHRVSAENNISTSALFDRLVVEEGETYNLSGWIKTNNITSANSRGARIYAVSYNAFSGSSAEGNSAYYNGTNDWSYFSFDISINSDRQRLTLFLEIRGESGEAWFDDIVLKKTSDL